MILTGPREGTRTYPCPLCPTPQPVAAMGAHALTLTCGAVTFRDDTGRRFWSFDTHQTA